MTVKLSFEFDSIQQAAEFCSRYQSPAKESAVCGLPAKESEALSNTVSGTLNTLAFGGSCNMPASAPTSEIKKRGKAAKPVEVVPATPAPVAVAPTGPAPSAESVIAALKSLAHVKGLQEAISLLAKYGTVDGKPCTRGSEVQEQDRASIIAQAKAA